MIAFNSPQSTVVRHPFRALALLAIPALLAAGCGSSPSNGGNSANQQSANQSDQGAQFIQCLNQHGIQAQSQNGHVNVAGNPSQQQLQAAQQACSQYAPVLKSGRPLSAQQRDQVARFVQCLNHHGVPAQQGSDGRPIIGGPNTAPTAAADTPASSSTSTGKQPPSTDQAQQAQQACQQYLPN